MRLSAVNTHLTADSVEWCPETGLEDVLACGTYQLEEGGRRRGSLSLFRWLQGRRELQQIVQDETVKYVEGVLDMKWRTSEVGVPLLGLACADGCVRVLRMRQAQSGWLLTEVSKTEVKSEDGKVVLCLSVDWAKDNSSVLAVSDSLGHISMLDIGDSSSRLLHRWRAHDYEAWIVALGHQPHLVLSGGDDCRLCVWDTRVGFVKASLVSKRHQMGVCTLQTHPSIEHILASGSYDESVVLWDIRAMGRPLKDVPTGGGVWRVKWHWREPDLMAAACMHNGCHIINCHLNSADPMAVIHSYTEHQSLAYGVDWCWADIGQGSNQRQDGCQSSSGLTSPLLASCSFYDHSLHIWTADIVT